MFLFQGPPRSRGLSRLPPPGLRGLPGRQGHVPIGGRAGESGSDGGGRDADGRHGVYFVFVVVFLNLVFERAGLSSSACVAHVVAVRSYAITFSLD